MSKPIIYVASPYTKGDPCINTHFQIKIFNQLLDDNLVVPVIPLTSHFLHTVHPRPYKDWIQYDLDILRVMDGCLRLTSEHKEMNYEVSESSGADGEVEHCKKLGKPVFYSIEELYKWCKNER